MGAELRVLSTSDGVTVQLSFGEAQELTVTLHDWWSHNAEGAPNDLTDSVGARLCGELSQVGQPGMK
jgi:hypothetical protein